MTGNFSSAIGQQQAARSNRNRSNSYRSNSYRTTHTRGRHLAKGQSTSILYLRSLCSYQVESSSGF